ncbi:antibiotic biosynthesis monooxygenase family protein [Parasphingorhabdus pacifica]
MVLESAVLNVRPGQETEFEATFSEAKHIIADMPGFSGLGLQRCFETPNRYLLLVRWRDLADHTEGFRRSSDYQEWKRLLHDFYDPFPTVEHYQSAETIEPDAARPQG